MSDTTHLENLILDLSVSVKNIETDVSIIKSDVSELKTDVAVLKSDMTHVKGRLDTLEDSIYEFREEFRSESTATRSLLNQAFEHISDQIASPDHKPTPSLVFRSRPRTQVGV